MTDKELQARNQRAQNLRVVPMSDKEFLVESAEGKIAYKVFSHNGQQICTCGDYASQIGRDPEFKCKHILAVINANGNLIAKNGTKPKLDDRFITTVQGKDFVIYAGLLDLAHQKGLHKIYVEAVQFPTKDNGQEAICKAVVESKSREVFTEWGDANPKNTNAKIAAHILRMAATRAKARALRDFTNIGMTCLEELGDLEDVIGGVSKPANGNGRKTRKAAKPEPTVAEEQKPPVTQPNTDTRPVSNPRAEAVCPSEAQLRAINNLARRIGYNQEELDDIVQQQFGTCLNNITNQEAATLIHSLQAS